MYFVARLTEIITIVLYMLRRRVADVYGRITVFSNIRFFYK